MLKDIKYMLEHLKPYRLRIAAAVGSGIMREICIMAAVGVCAYMAAFLAAGGHFRDWMYLEILAAIVILRAVFTYLDSFISHDVAYHILVDFRVKLYGAFEKISPDILFCQRSGQTTTTLMNDVEVLEWFYAHTAGVVVVDSVVIAVVTAFLANLNWRLAVLMLIGAVLIVLVTFVNRKQAGEQGWESRFRLGEANSVTLEGIAGMPELLTLGADERYKKKNRRFMDALTKIQVAYAKRMGKEGGLFHLVSGGFAVIINICAVWLTLHGELAMEWFAVVGSTIWLVYSPLLELCNMIRNFGIIFSAAARIAKVLKTPPVIKEEGKITDVFALNSNITFEGVHYRYTNTKTDVLNGINCQIKEGSITAFIGASGAGKTTCIRLLDRIWDVSEGRICIGGLDIREMTLDALHKLIAVVPQEVYLFHISIKENIRLGRPEASDEEVVRAAQEAEIHDFIMSLPEGYETNAGERGIQMSGGQRQRIAIARALLMDSPILIMDEAVSNLDTRMEQEIQKTIKGMSKNKTVVLVAHRPSTIMQADHLIVLERGRVVREGRPSEIMNKKLKS